MRSLLVAALLSMASSALAQSETKRDRVIVSRRTIINLNAQLIEGAVQGPEMTTIFVSHRPRFGPAIRLRHSFRGELLGSAADL